MAKLPNGILGGIRGRVGPVVGTKWKGIEVIRARPAVKRRRSTEQQLGQMSRLSIMTTFIAPLSDFLNSTYKAVFMSCFNKSLSYNMRNAIDGDYPSFRISYKRFVLGVGDLLNVENPVISSVSKGNLTIHWNDNSNEGSARASDQLFVAVYCEDSRIWRAELEGPKRNAGSYTLDVSAFSGKAVHAYLGFLSADAKFVTTSLYTGSIHIL
jgi:hypothetical protein